MIPSRVWTTLGSALTAALLLATPFTGALAQGTTTTAPTAPTAPIPTASTPAPIPTTADKDEVVTGESGAWQIVHLFQLPSGEHCASAVSFTGQVALICGATPPAVPTPQGQTQAPAK